MINSTSVTSEARYEALVEDLLNNPDVTRAKQRGFGSGLRAHGKVFAMLVKDKLVVKLPQQRVVALIAAGEGEPYEYGQRRVAKEWVAIASGHEAQWPMLAREALAFVGERG